MEAAVAHFTGNRNGVYVKIMSELVEFKTSSLEGKKIVAVGAHPDDLEFGAGGTLIKLSGTNNVITVVVTDGGMGTHNEEDEIGIAKIRLKENRDAAKMMGIGRDIYWSYPDLSLENYKRSFQKRMVKLLLSVRPDVVMTFDPWGRYEPLLHPDHRTVAWGVVEAVLKSTLPKYLKRHGFKNKFLPSKPQVWLMAPGEANVGVDITSVWERKWEVISIHKSQFDSKEIYENLKKRLTVEWFGKQGKGIGVDYAETFRILEYSGERAA